MVKELWFERSLVGVVSGWDWVRLAVELDWEREREAVVSTRESR